MHREARGAQQVDIEDIIAALIEYGHLTRYVLYALEIDPKVVLARPGLFSERIREVIQRHKSIDESDEEVDQDVLTELQAMAMSYTVRERDAFSEHLAEVFLRADRLCGSDRSQRKITEEDVLRSVCDCERWVWPVRPQSSGRMQLVELPDSQELLTWLNQPLEDRGVDADGGVVLLDLDSDAQQIIDSAHRQSQQRGLSTIPFRLLLAAFLGEPKGFVSGLCQRHGIDARGLADLLIATTNADSPSTFALTHEVCNRAVLPVLSVARAYNHEGLLSEAHLFRALCEIAPSDLTKVIRNDLPNKLCADLEQLGEETTSYLRRQAETDESSQPANDGMGESRSRRLEDIPFDKRLDSVILAASQIALTQGYLQIRTPHLLIALIAYGRGSVRAAFQQGPLSLDQLVIGLLSAVPPQALTERPSGKPQFGPSVQALWDKTLRDYLAHSQAAHSRAADSRASETTERPRLDEVHLLTKMLADSTAPIVTILHQLGYQAVIQRWQSKYGDGGLHRE